MYRKSVFWYKFLIVFLTISLLMPMLVACNGSDSQSESLLGIVELDNPIEGATVSIYDTKGNLIHKEANATSETGAFFMRIPKALPADFRIEATGGKDNLENEAFTGILSAEIRGYDEQIYSYLHLGPVSTLLATYMTEHPEITYEMASNKVTEFLGLDPEIDIITDLALFKGIFNARAFEAEAEQIGGFNEFINLLVQQVDTPEVEYHEFIASGSGGSLVMGIGGTAAKWILTQLASGVLSYIGGEAAGWVLDQITGGGPTDPALVDISVKLDRISSQISSLSTQLKAGLGQIADLIKKTTYQQRADALNAPISKIQARMKSLIYIAQFRQEDAESDKRAAESVLEDIDTVAIQDALQQIHNSLVDTGGVPGLIRVWGEMAIKESWGKNDYGTDRYINLENQFVYYASLQLHGLTLLIEKYHALGQNGRAEEALMTFMENIEEQGDLFLTSVETMMAWQHSYGGNNPAFDASPYQPEWSFEWVSHDSYITKVVESSTLKKADEVLGNFLGRTNAVTIRIFTIGSGALTYDLNKSSLSMTLDYGPNRISGGELLVGEPIKEKIIDLTFLPYPRNALFNDGGKPQIYRYTFINLPESIYYLHDNNDVWYKVRYHRTVKGKGILALLINPKLLNLQFVVTEYDPYHNQLIWAWLPQ